MTTTEPRRRPAGADRARDLVRAHGTTYAEEAGIALKDTPAPLYRLLVLSTLLAARIRSAAAVAAARELWAAGLGTPQKMVASSHRHRVAALGRGGYRRFDERTAAVLADGARAVLADYGGDLRRLRDGAGSPAAIRAALLGFPGIGPAGAAIFCREAQGVWPVLAPAMDDLVLEGARTLGLPADAGSLAALVGAPDLPRLAAACVRVARDPRLADRAGTTKAPGP